jgi:hypothetical protein
MHMKGSFVQQVIYKQIENGKKHTAVALGVHETMDPHTADMLCRTFNAWVVKPRNNDCFRLAGLHLQTIYIDESSELDPDTMAYLLTRVRPPKDENPITTIRE